MSWWWWLLGYVVTVALFVAGWIWALRERRREGGN